MLFMGEIVIDSQSTQIRSPSDFAGTVDFSQNAPPAAGSEGPQSLFYFFQLLFDSVPSAVCVVPAVGAVSADPADGVGVCP